MDYSFVVSAVGRETGGRSECLDIPFAVSVARQGFRGCKPMKRNTNPKNPALALNLWFSLDTVFFFVSFGLVSFCLVSFGLVWIRTGAE